MNVSQIFGNEEFKALPDDAALCVDVIEEYWDYPWNSGEVDHEKLQKYRSVVIRANMISKENFENVVRGYRAHAGGKLEGSVCVWENGIIKGIEL